MKLACSMGVALALLLPAAALAQPAAAPAAPAPAGPAEMISNFRLAHGEGRVTLDLKLTQIAHDQAAAMAAKDVLSHEVLGPFVNRVAPARAGQAAENVAYGNDGFPKTLEQWIHSPGHLKNLLMPGASRVGVASARSAATRRTYWAMVIAGGYEKTQPPRSAKKPAPKTAPKTAAKTAATSAPKAASQPPRESCRMKLLGLCL
ncbi:CAP domain-containing protein [Rhodopseudomonas palustris]|uniref:Allergen V5/Tpx-1 related n=1 Tax=Rhodopseudomonas palustris (strain BisB18) TaxID=316056 RepID=Q213U9_RHOPB